MSLTEAVLKDDSGKLTALWFNQPYLQKSLTVGSTYRLAGKVTASKFGLRLISPLHEPTTSERGYLSPLLPVYSLPKGISQALMRRLVRTAEPLAAELEETLPGQVRRRFGLVSLAEAVREAHFPATHDGRDAARRRLGFDELFRLELSMAELRRLRQGKKGIPVRFDEAVTRRLVAALPFRLTDDQRRAAWEALLDMAKAAPMNRLLDGDVGSGKTVVAAIAMINAAASGCQSALMAPTEILAKQHYESLKKVFAGQPVSVALWTNAYRRCFADGKELACANKAEAARLADDIAAGRVPVVVGTHALIEEAVGFRRLALAVVDEQHRFGVRARQLLCEKGAEPGVEPHLLSMTATPIPRSLALTVLGDLDLSLLRQKPKDRKPILTRLVPASRRTDAYDFIREQIAAGRQAFVVCPLIEESEAVETVSAEEEFDRLSKVELPGIGVGLLHGRLAAAEKEAVMRDFLERKIMALVSTSVVEVGIDVPNATVMCISGAERFGLAQLHQFRGRVGRSEHQSYCLLLPSTDEAAEKERLRAMVELQDGFDLAEKDLAMRGPGELLGELQSGFPGFRVASLGDARLIQEVKAAVAMLGGEQEKTAEAVLSSNALNKVHLE